jgi:hypothetical protein
MYCQILFTKLPSKRRFALRDRTLLLFLYNTGAGAGGGRIAILKLGAEASAARSSPRQRQQVACLSPLFKDQIQVGRNMRLKIEAFLQVVANASVMSWATYLRRQPAGFSGNQGPKIGCLNRADNRGVPPTHMTLAQRGLNKLPCRFSYPCWNLT